MKLIELKFCECKHCKQWNFRQKYPNGCPQVLLGMILALNIKYSFIYQNYFLWYFPAAVVISFFVCWTPFHTQRLGYVFFAHLKNHAGYIFRTINEFLYSISGICYYASSTINPILYNMMSSRYRQAFKNTLCGLTGSKCFNRNLNDHICYDLNCPYFLTSKVRNLDLL